MTEIVSVERDGPDTARSALERMRGGGRGRDLPGRHALRPRLRSARPPGGGADPLDQGARRRQALGRHVLLATGHARARLRTSASAPAKRSPQLLPGPVTLVIANPERRYPLASRDDPERLGVRLIEGPLAGAMTPIFQTSANRSGEPGPAELRARSTTRCSQPRTWRSTAARADRRPLDGHRPERARLGGPLGGPARGRAAARRDRSAPGRDGERLGGRRPRGALGLGVARVGPAALETARRAARSTQPTSLLTSAPLPRPVAVICPRTSSRSPISRN